MIRPKDVVKGLLTFLVSAVVSLYALELVFRIWMVEPVVPRTQEAFRARIAVDWPRPIGVTPAPGAFRIIALGDSFGRAGRQNNFNYLVEQKLRSRSPHVELVNLSVPAVELHDELILWNLHGPRYQPHLVVHSLFVGNDLLMPDGDLVDFGGIVMRRTWEPASWLPRRWLFREWWKRRSVVWRHQRARTASLYLFQLELTTNVANALAGELPPRKDSFSEEEFLRIERQRLEVSGDTPEWHARRAAALEVLDELRLAVENAGADYVVVLHPDQFQVEEDLRRRISEAYDLNIEAGYDLDLPQKEILRHCRTHQIRCLDLLPRFREVGAEGGLYLARNTHYGPPGNRLAAELITRFLRHEGLVP